MATPSAAPDCWMVSLSAEPTPACSPGMAPISALAAAGMPRPEPTPSTSMARATLVKPSPTESVASSPNPPAMTSMPAAVSTRAGSFLPSAAPTPLKTSEATASGMKARPVSVGENSSTNWRCWVSTSISPPVAKVSRTSEKLAPVNTRLRNSLIGTIGASVRTCRTANPASAATATASAPSVPGLVKPSRGSTMIDQTSAVMPTIDSTMPGRSGRRHGPLDSGISSTAARTATAATGTLSRKTAPHQKCAMSAPPSTGPPTRPTMATAVQAAIAFGRSSSSKTVIRMESVLGMTSAPPTPIRTRPAISWPGLSAMAATSEAAPNRASPMIITFRRPKRSERLPEVSSRPAKTRMYESMIHWMSCAPALRSSAIGGMDTVSTMLSITSTRLLRQSTTRMSQRRGLRSTAFPLRTFRTSRTSRTVPRSRSVRGPRPHGSRRGTHRPPSPREQRAPLRTLYGRRTLFATPYSVRNDLC